MDNPLVSVVVITYNSAETIIETLESIKAQTYQNIELIISDDYSKDKTIIIAEKWLGCNQERFKRVIVNISDKNKGIPANCNNGCRLAAGIWIKIIAGDDALMPNCIKDYISFISKKNVIKACHSSKKVYEQFLSDKNLICEHFKQNNITTIPESTSEQQLNALFWGPCIEACTLFFQKALFDEIKGFDERIRLSEDWAFYIKICLSGNKWYFLDKDTVKYRVNSKSVYSGSSINHIFPTFYKTEKIVYEYWIKPYARWNVRFYWRYLFFIKETFAVLGMNTRIWMNVFMYKLIVWPANILKKHGYDCITN